ncbi:MAG: LptF/LptG family permease [Deltaproteobacteria bacterium]|nr:LptF/LptG family permease [Deltaproteobacteria bacterium]
MYNFAMRITRYLAGNVLTRSVLTLALVVTVYAAIDFVETSSLHDAPLTQLLFYYPLRIPMIVSQVLPLALSLGVLLALASSRSRGEWDAMRAAGISPAILAKSLLVIPLVGVLVSLPILAEIAPRALLAWHSGFIQDASKSIPLPSWCKEGSNLIKEAGPNGTHIIIGRSTEGSPLLWTRSDPTFPKGDVWRPEHGWQLADVRKPHIARCSSLDERVRLTSSMSLPGASLTVKQLLAATSKARSKGLRDAPLRAEMALRIALAAACLIVPLLGLGFGLLGEESRSTRLVARGLIGAAVFWLSLAAAWNGASLGAWSPNWVAIGVPLFYLAVGLSAVLVATRK